MRPLDQNTLSKVESFSNEYQKINGLSPSFRQIMHEVRLGSVATARRYVLALESEGRIQRTNLGNIETPIKLKKGGTTMALLVGDIACGDPTESEENIEENIELPNAIFGGGDLFLLHAKGDSMIGAGIEKGDLLVIRKQNSANDGEIVVALTEGRNTLKRIFHRQGKIILHPENPSLQDIVVKSCEVQGVLVSCIKMYG